MFLHDEHNNTIYYVLYIWCFTNCFIVMILFHITLLPSNSFFTYQPSLKLNIPATLYVDIFQVHLTFSHFYTLVHNFLLKCKRYLSSSILYLCSLYSVHSSRPGRNMISYAKVFLIRTAITDCYSFLKTILSFIFFF